MRLAGAARKGDRYDASLVGPNERKNDSQDEMSNSVLTTRLDGSFGRKDNSHNQTESAELGGRPYVQGVCYCPPTRG